jgi:DNA-binding transcriptional ArsR family regulator
VRLKGLPVSDRDLRKLAEAYRRPPRGQILSALSERPGATVRELAERLGQPPRRVRHHIEVMAEAGLIEVAADGSGARRYRADVVAFEQPDRFGIETSAAIVREIVRLLHRDISASIAAGTFGTRTDDHTVRMYGEVDDACFEELAAIHWLIYREMGAAVEAGKKRVAASRAAGTEIVSALFFFESPLWGEIGSPRPAEDPPAALEQREGADGPEDIRLVPATPLDPEGIAAVHADPVRFRVLQAMAERPGVSIRQISERVGEPPRRVRHQVEALLACGLATITAEKLRAGVIERRYGAPSLLIEETAPLGRETEASLARAVVLLLLGDVATAEAAGTLSRHRDDVEVRFYGEVDEACLEDLAFIHRRAHFRIQATIETGRERLRVNGGEGIEIVSAHFLFEAPVWTSAQPGG